MQTEQPQPPQTHLHLNLQLINPIYNTYQTHPQQYLFQLITKHTLWPQKIPQHILNFLQAINHLYHPVPYHNLTHAFDVMTNLDQYLTQYGWQMKLNINEHQRIFMLIAAYAHDSGHEGFTNAYYKNGKHQLVGESESPLQFMHASNLRRLVRDYQLEIPSAWMEMMTEMILKTDNFYHGWLIEKADGLSQLKQLEIQEQPHLITANCFLLHVADLNNTTKDIQLSVKWTNKLYIQFQTQRIREKEQGLPISYERIETNLQFIKSNISFLDHMILPLFKSLTQLQSQCKPLLDKILKNRQYWQQQQKKQLQGQTLDMA